MKDISIYFEPISESISISKKGLGESIVLHDKTGFPSINEKGIAIIYVPEYRGEDNHEGSNEIFREELYKLFKGDNWNDVIYDLMTHQFTDRFRLLF